MLLEFGFIIPQGINKITNKLTEILDSNQLSVIGYQTFSDLKEEFIANDNLIKEVEKRLKILADKCDLYKKLKGIPGIGLITGTALVASIGNASCFQNGRQLASWLGLVPRQNSSGGKITLLGISKRGDVYLRSLLVQGARAVLNSKLRYISKERQAHENQDKFTAELIRLWLQWLINWRELCLQY